MLSLSTFNRFQAEIVVTQKSASTSAKRRYHHGDLRHALLQAAAEQLRHVTPDELSLRELARTCGVSRTAPYRHFDNREALLTALALEAFRDFAASLRASGDGIAGPARRLESLGQAYVTFATNEPHRLRLMFGREAIAKSRSPELAAAAGAAFQILSDAVSDVLPADPEGDADQATATLGAWALVHGLSVLYLDLPPGVFGDDLTLPDQVRRITAIFSRGLQS